MRVDCARGEARRPSRRNLVDETTRPLLQDQCSGVSNSFCILNSGFVDGSAELAPTGTPDEIQARIRKNRALGIDGFIMALGRRIDPDDVRLLGREIVPAFR